MRQAAEEMDDMTTTHKTTAETRRIYARKNTTAFTIAFVLTQRADAIRNGKMTSEETTT